MERFILHLNVADFAVAVERVLDCRLRQRPVIIAPPDLARALVYDMSEEAYQAGVRKGMMLGQARRTCRDAVVVAPRPDRYEQAMLDCLQRARPFSPRIERAFGDGHMYLDLTGTRRLLGPAVDVAWRLRNSFRQDLDLDPIWSLASNKLVAKVASRLVKPRGEYIVNPGEELSFLTPLPLGLLPGLRPDDLRRLREFNLLKNGQVANLTLAQLAVIFPRPRAGLIYEAVRGIDASPVLPLGEARPQVSFAEEFCDSNDWAAVSAILHRLTQKCGFELRRRGLASRRLGLILDYSDNLRVIRQATARSGALNDPDLFLLARTALARGWTRRVRLRRLCLICDRLMQPARQLSLFAGERRARQQQDHLAAALDKIRSRFGRESIGPRASARENRSDKAENNPDS